MIVQGRLIEPISQPCDTPFDTFYENSPPYQPTRVYGSGARTTDVCNANPHVQPDDASGMSTSPPAGMMLIRQPGRVTAVRSTHLMTCRDTVRPA
jgi:hypothetical protein